MRELIDRLNDTTTHLDLGLDGPGTQYTDSNGNEATWTYYASSKFAFLYHLIQSLRNEDESFVVIARKGRTMDLLDRYMEANHVNFRRVPPVEATSTPRTEGATGSLQVFLLESGSDVEIQATARPSIIVAFDSTFDPQDAQVSQIRDKFASDGLVPIVYLLAINSAEFADLCIPRDMPSQQRLQLLLQATFRACPNLGGDPEIIQSPSSRVPLTPMNAFAALKKSLERKIRYPAEEVARAILSDDFDLNWPCPTFELKLEPLAEISPERFTESGAPSSRAGTPSAQKRLLVSKENLDRIETNSSSRMPSLCHRSRLSGSA